jgi:hypothetical protein
MKNVLRLLLIAAALATAFALPAYAQGTQAAAGPCGETEAQAALYQKFRDNFKGTPDKQKIAYDAGNEYLSKYGGCTDDEDRQVNAHLRAWTGKYEEAVRIFNEHRRERP